MKEKREIKFRAWIKKDGQMFNQGDQYLQSFLKRCVRLSSVDVPSEHEKYGDYELMQFTGLTDKNGVEIYEDDLIKFFYDGQHWSGVVSFKEGSFYINVDEIISMFRWYDYSEREVIGNIHQNPELL